MNKNTPTLIVLEGIDGSGKTTQADLLTAYLQEKMPLRRISFPDYDSPSSALVKLYLAGEIGEGEEVNVYAASTFYAADRYVSFHKHWQEDYRNGTLILAARYTTSNIVHQMPRLPRAEWDNYLQWIQENEYQRMQLPAPDLVIYLDVLPIISQNLLEKRYAGDNKKKDILEKDIVYTERCREGALYAGERLGWNIVKCYTGESVSDVEQIQQQVRQVVEKFLSQPSRR